MDPIPDRRPMATPPRPSSASSPIRWTRYVTAYGYARTRTFDLPELYSSFFSPPHHGSEYGRALRCRTLESLLDERVVVVLGESGMGRSTAIGQLAERVGGRILTGVSIDESPALAESMRNLSAGVSLFIDDIDLARVGTTGALARLTEGLHAAAKDIPARLWLTARPGCWSDEATKALAALCPDGIEPTVVYLAPLTEGDIRAAAASHDIDSEPFVEGIKRAHATRLAGRPETLLLLLDHIHHSGGLIPAGRTELYEALCIGACRSEATMIAAARLAACMVFGGHDLVCPANGLSVDAVSGRPIETLSDGRALFLRPGDIGRVLRDTSLMVEVPLANGGWRWKHSRCASYLAAWYVRHRGLSLGGITGLFGHAAGSGSDQLATCAAFALDLLDGSRRACLISLFPEAELQSDLHMRSEAERLGAARRLLARCEAGERDKGYDLYKLAADGLDDVLRPYLADATRDRVARKQAIAISRECRISSLVEPLLRLALDPHEPYWLRSDAAHAVAELGSHAQLAGLCPLLERSPAEDESDELLGITLAALWESNYLSAADVISHLRSPQRSRFHGAYASLLSRLSKGVPSWIDAEALRVVVQTWPESLNATPRRFRRRPSRTRGFRSHLETLRTAMIEAAALRLDEPAFGDLLIQWFRGVGQSYSLGLLTQALDQRPELLPSLLTLWAQSKLDPFDLARTRAAPGFSVNDVLDFIAADQPAPLLWLFDVIDALRQRGDETGDERLRVLYIEDPVTFARYGKLHHCELRGSEADAVREAWARQQKSQIEHEAREAKWARQEEERKAAEQPYIIERPSEWVNTALAKIEGGDAGWLPNLVYRLSLRPNEPYDLGWYAFKNLHTAYGWHSADAQTRHRILDVIERHLIEGDFGDTSFWLTSTVPGAENAAVAALNLLASERPESIDHFPSRSWLRWIPILLHGAREAASAHIISAVRQRSSDEVVRRIIERVRADAVSPLGVSLDMKRWAQEWPDLTRTACVTLVEESSLAPEKRGVVARYLIQLEQGNALQLLGRTLTRITDDNTWAQVGGGAFSSAPVIVWPLIDHRFGAAEPGVARALLEVASGNASRGSHLPSALTVQQNATLLGWLDTHYPDSQDPGSYTGFSPWPFRHAVIEALRQRATPEAAQTLRDAGYRYAALDTEADWRRARWRPPTIGALRCLFTDPEATRIHTDQDWQAWVFTALGTLRDQVAPGELWHRAEAGRWRPASEQRIIALIAGALRASLGQHLADGAVEVTIDEERPGDVRCTFDRDPEHFEVTVEVHPNWQQTCDAPPATDRVRLVPWFGGFAWSRRTEPDDQRKRAVAESWTPESVAAALAERGVVLDLRQVETTADLDAALPFGSALRAALAQEGLRPTQVTSFGDRHHWLIRVALPDALRHRFGLAPEALLLAAAGEVRATLLGRARREVDGEDLNLDFDLMLVVSDAPRLVERVERETRFRQCVPWPTSWPPLAEWLPSRLRAFDAFDTDHPVRGNRLLERDDQVAELSRRVLSGDALTVVGLRKVGKTSLVRGVADRLCVAEPANGLRFAWLDLQDVALRTEAGLAAGLGRALGVEGTLTTVDGILRAYESALDECTRLCVVLDEFDLLFVGYDGQPPIPGHAALLRGLRGIAQTTERLSLVLIGQAPERLEAPLLDGFPNPMLGWTHWTWVTPFGSPSARRALEHLSRRVAVEFSPEHLDLAFIWTGGHPALLRQFGSAAFQSLRSVNAIHTDVLDSDEMLDDVLDRELFRTVARDIVGLLWRKDRAAHELLVALAQSDDAAGCIERHGGRRGAPLRILRRLGVVFGDRAAPRLPLFLSNYLRSYHTPETHEEVNHG